MLPRQMQPVACPVRPMPREGLPPCRRRGADDRAGRLRNPGSRTADGTAHRRHGHGGPRPDGDRELANRRHGRHILASAASTWIFNTELSKYPFCYALSHTGRSINDVVLAGHSALTPPLPGRDIVADLKQATAITEECLANSANIAGRGRRRPDDAQRGVQRVIAAGEDQRPTGPEDRRPGRRTRIRSAAGPGAGVARRCPAAPRSLPWRRRSRSGSPGRTRPAPPTAPRLLRPPARQCRRRSMPA